MWKVWDPDAVDWSDYSKKFFSELTTKHSSHLETFLYLRVPGEDSKEGVIIVCRSPGPVTDYFLFYPKRTFLPKLGSLHRYLFLGWFPDSVRSETTSSHLTPLRSKSLEVGLVDVHYRVIFQNIGTAAWTKMVFTHDTTVTEVEFLEWQCASL